MASKIYNGLEDCENIEYDLWENVNANRDSKDDISIKSNSEELSAVRSDNKTEKLKHSNLPDFYMRKIPSYDEKYGDFDFEISATQYENFNCYKNESYVSKRAGVSSERYVEPGNALECIGEPTANLIELLVDSLINVVGFAIDKIFF